ncbi:MAG: C25 family cysteine peptidase [Fidelibacterota bacterium]
MAVEQTSLEISLSASPKVLDGYFSFPKTNTQYIEKNLIVDIFRWKVQANDPSHIHCIINSEVWKSYYGEGILGDGLSNPTISIQHIKDSDYFVDIIPWKVIDGETKYLFRGKITLSIAHHGKILSGPGIIEPMHNSSIPRSLSDSLQYLILTNQSLEPAAQSIANLYNNEISPEYRLRTDVAIVDTILSPIRDFLFQQITANPQLQYVLFLGDETVILPLYIYVYDQSIPGLINRPSDDFFTSYPEFSAYVHLTTGRVPVNQLSDAMIFVEKLREYVLNPVQGNWKKKLVLLADDTNKNNGDISTEISHVQNSDDIYQLIYQLLDVQPIYGTEYQPVPGDGWLLQPQMTDDTIESINNGIGMINYIGHGSPTTLADEKIIQMERDLSSIHDQTGAIWVVGTCSFGWYDDRNCMTEELLKKPDGGIAVISTTFKVNVFSNSNYLSKLFDNIRAYIEHENSYRLGDLVRYSKDGGQNYLFHTFGDPAMPLPFPRKNVVIDTIATSTSLEILQSFELNVLPEFTTSSGYAEIKSNENQVTRTFESGSSQISVSYSLPGNVIFQGDFFSSLSFIVPLDIPACDTCKGSIHLFSEGDGISTDFLGNIPIISISGNLTDLEGPNVTVQQNGTQISNTGIISPPYVFQIWLTDESGINLIGSTGHQLRYQIDQNPITEFTDLFNPVSATEGFCTLDLSSEQSGVHSLWVEAWDNANNRREVDFQLSFSVNEKFRVELIYNYPNPFSDDTYFTFVLSDPAQVSIRIFTSDGHHMITLRRNDLEAGYHSIYWDGKDSSGLIPANGTYFYQLKAKTASGEKFESIHKITRMN